MEVSVSDAKARFSELVHRAEADEDAILTHLGHKPSVAERRALVENVQAAAKEKAAAGSCAAESQDFLYDQAGLPA